ncbi:MAG: hypothetical protein WCJ39_01710 [bacterium]
MTNTPTITANSPTISGLPLGANPAQGSSLITPQASGNFLVSLTVSNSAGSTTCDAPLTVTVPPLSCALMLSPNPAQAATPTNVAWIVTGTNFFATSLYVTPNLAGAWPHAINANQYIGNTFALLPTNASGSYVFSLTVHNAYATASCTGILATTPPPPPALHITKTLINNIAYHSGDLVGFRIDFSNTGTGTAHHVVLEDYLPVSLAYVSSSLQ